MTTQTDAEAPVAYRSNGTGDQSFKAEPDVGPPEVDEAPGRRYRDAPVRTVDLPPSFLEAEGGPFTRKGTPRLALLCAARAALLQRKEDAADTDALRYDSGRHAVRKEGTHVKSIQGHAEDIWRRVYKRPVPQDDPLDDPEFRTFYDRTRRALKRSDLVEDMGPAVPDPSKKIRDRHGKRWRLSEATREAQKRRETADPLPFVRCTGPPVEDDTADVWTCVERRVARENDLHREFSHAVTASELGGPRWTGDGRRFERRYARDGGDRPRYCTIGRWRPEAVDRPDRRRQAVRVPWIVAEIDGRNEQGEKDRGVSDRLARRLLRRLDTFDVDLSDVVVSYSGNASIHVRIPDGAIGCPLYRSARDATESIGRFFDRLCGRDEELRRAIDGACFRPGQLIRAIGSTHEATGRQTVATTADRFLEKPSSFLWHLSEPQFEYSPPEAFPLPRRAGFVSGLSALLDPPVVSPSNGVVENECSTECIPPGVERARGSAVGRVEKGVREGEPWGPDVGRPCAVGRNWAALFVAHEALRECPGREAAWTVVRRWNQRNDPPLPRGELKEVFEKACRYQRGHCR